MEGKKPQLIIIDTDSGFFKRYEEDIIRRYSVNAEVQVITDPGFVDAYFSTEQDPDLMLIDEEGKLKKGPVSINCLASDLYGADRHGDAIVGNVIIVRAEDERLTLLTKDEANALAAGMEAMRDQAVEKISAAFGLKPIVKPELEIVDLSRRQSCRKNSMER